MIGLLPAWSYGRLASQPCRSANSALPRQPHLYSRPSQSRRRRRSGKHCHAAVATAAPAASPSADVRPIQPQPFALTPDGFVPHTATLSAVPPELQPLLGAAVETCREQLGSVLLGVYLRGSLAQPGCFVPGLSDADFFVLHLASDEAEADQSEGAVAERLRAAAERLQRRFPQCVKVELKSVPLGPGSSLYPWAQRQREQQQQQQQQENGAAAAAAGDPPAAAGRSKAAGGEAAGLPSSALVGHEGLAFQLKTQAVRVWGWDLPALLPDVAALPPSLELLPGLADDVAAAVAHAERQLQSFSVPADGASGSGSTAADGQRALEAAARSARWALKRCLRAALELSMLSMLSGRPGQGWSRDLYWCAELAAEQLPQLEPGLRRALRLYVSLADVGSSGDGSRSGDGSGRSSGSRDGSSHAATDSSTAKASQQRQRQSVEEGAAAAAELAAELDRLFLQAMLAEDPGWLEPHQDSRLAGSRGSGRQGNSIDSSSGSSGLASSSGSSGPASSSSSWWQRVRVGLWAAGAGLSGKMDADFVGAPPPPVAAAVCGPVLTLDWREARVQHEAAAIIAAALSGDQRGAGQGASPSSQPILLKGAAARWPAVRRWSLARLAASGLEGRARLAPSLQFPFTEPRLAGVLARQQGPAALPSCLASMSAAKFAARLQRGNPCGLEPLVYGRGSERRSSSTNGSTSLGSGSAAANLEAPEYAYFQAELPPGLLADCDLASPPFVLPDAAAGGRQGRMRQTQAARVWAGPQGTISPTHYDLSHSFLTQIAGRKRMLFWSPDELPLLYFYPDTHLLRRRSRVNVHLPDSARFPLFGRAAACEAVLEPGDVVFFPSRWAHYTESLDFSLSVTCRYGAAAGGGGE